LAGFGTVQTPPVHTAGLVQPWPFVASQGMPSAIGAWHVPLVALASAQLPPPEHWQ
jgi:hypothetical protein